MKTDAIFYFILQCDRFIPSRSAMNLDRCNMQLKENPTSPSLQVSSPAKEEYKKQLKQVCGAGKEGGKILAFKSKPPAPPEGYDNAMRVLYSQNAVGDKPKKKAFRHIPSSPERILDAPELIDDYYLNLLDWSSTNIVSILCHGL